MPQQPKKKPDPRRRMVGAVVRMVGAVVRIGRGTEFLVVKPGTGFTQRRLSMPNDPAFVGTLEGDVFTRWARRSECETMGLSWHVVKRNIQNARAERRPKKKPATTPKPAAAPRPNVAAPVLGNRHKLALLSVKGGCDVYSHALAMELREVEAAAPVGKLYVLIMPAVGHFPRERPYFAAIPTAAGLAWAEAK